MFTQPIGGLNSKLQTNCSRHVLSIANDNPDDRVRPITNEAFRSSFLSVARSHCLSNLSEATLVAHEKWHGCVLLCPGFINHAVIE